MSKRNRQKREVRPQDAGMRQVADTPEFTQARYFTKEALAEAIRIGEQKNYNRQLFPQILEDIEGDVHPAVFGMIDCHIGGVPAMSYARLRVSPKFKPGIDCMEVFIDVPVDFWMKLPILSGQ